MKQLNWGDELCGKVIAPEEWGDGVVEYDMPAVIGLHGMWRSLLLGMDFPWGSASRPIYPPADWAGKTEEEMWCAISCGLSFIEVTDGVYVYPDGRVGVMLFNYAHAGGSPKTIADPAALILALQNALVLSKRLKAAV